MKPDLPKTPLTPFVFRSPLDLLNSPKTFAGMPAFLPPHSFNATKRSIHVSHLRKRIRPPACTLPQIPRRTALKCLSLLALSPHLPAYAASTVTLGDKESSTLHGYSFLAPTGWTRNSANISSARTATIFINDEDADSNVNMVVTPVPSDFQKLTSFGSLDNVLQTMVPKSGNDISGEVISTRRDVPNNAYVIEYKVTSKGVDRHLLTVFSLQPGRYLLTLTGQAKEENWNKREPVIRAVADSYRLQILD